MSADVGTAAAIDLTALDFNNESCMWINPDCWNKACWTAVCVGCSCDLGGVCDGHRALMLIDPGDAFFCRKCDITGSYAEIVVFIPLSA